LINDKILSTSIQGFIEKYHIHVEKSLEIYYSFAIDKPKETASIPQEEWISTLRPLTHILNEKPKTYLATFFNGDIKLFSKTNKEILSVK